MPSIPFEKYWTLVLKPSKKGINPPHLKPYQDKMRQIAPFCAEKTKKFKGTKRVIKFNQCILELTQKKDDQR